MEIFKAIPGYENLYEASNIGRIKSLIPWNGTKERILKFGKNSHGYKFVILCNKTEKKTKSIHSLVMETFVGPLPPGMEVCHNNGDKLDNRMENLRYDTKSNNQLDRKLHGTSNDGSRCGTSKLKEFDVINIRRLLKTNITQRKIAEKFGVGENAISRIKLGKRWASL